MLSVCLLLLLVGASPQVLVIKNVRVFRRKESGQVLLQGLASTKVHLNPSIKAARALRAWVEARRVEDIQGITGERDARAVEKALSQANGNQNQAVNIILDSKLPSS